MSLLRLYNTVRVPLVVWARESLPVSLSELVSYFSLWDRHDDMGQGANSGNMQALAEGTAAKKKGTSVTKVEAVMKPAAIVLILDGVRTIDGRRTHFLVYFTSMFWSSRCTNEEVHRLRCLFVGFSVSSPD